MKSEIKVIDYLIENGGCDTCGKCAYAKPLDENGDIKPCLEFDKDGSVACRNGMIEYFRNNE